MTNSNQRGDHSDLHRKASNLRDAYLLHAIAASHGESAEDTAWASDAFEALVRTDPDEAWPLIIDVLNRAADDATLAYIAAGPLENLIVLHSSRVIDRIEATARRNEQFRRALTGVWAQGDIPEEISKRLENAVAGESPL